MKSPIPESAPKLHNKKPCIKTIAKLNFLFDPKVLNIPNSLILSSTDVFNIPLIRTPEISIAIIETNTNTITKKISALKKEIKTNLERIRAQIWNYIFAKDTRKSKKLLKNRKTYI